MREDIEKFLQNAGISPTPVRVMVYRSLYESESPLSLADLETKLDSVDKSTISRSLSILKKQKMIHAFNDGSGSVKYEICRSLADSHDNDTHVHFRCQVCGQTICLSSIKAPIVDLPDGYEPHEINYVITGICPDCSK